MRRSKFEREQFKKEFAKRIHSVVIKIINITVGLSREPQCQIIKNQLIRAVTSIGANYFEAQAASSKNDFSRFFSYSLKSANEVKFWLNVIRDCKMSNQEIIIDVEKEVVEIANIFAASILTMKERRNSEHF